MQLIYFIQRMKIKMSLKLSNPIKFRIIVTLGPELIESSKI